MKMNELAYILDNHVGHKVTIVRTGKILRLQCEDCNTDILNSACSEVVDRDMWDDMCEQEGR